MSAFSQLKKFKVLEQTYKKWQDLQSKGELKMKMKISKCTRLIRLEKKQYYDFDYSRYQYYYNYPKDHFAFQTPDKQKKLFENLLPRILQTQTKIFDENYSKNNNLKQKASDDQKNNIDDQEKLNQDQFNSNNEYSNKFFAYLKPYELQTFLDDFRNKVKDKVVTLRIKKSLLTPKKVKQAFLDTQKKANAEAVVQLIQTEIRSYLVKLNRINQFNFQFQKDLVQRLQQKKSHLQTNSQDEMHFSLVEKADLIIYQRLIKTDFKLKYHLRCLEYDVSLMLMLRYADVQRKVYLKSIQSINQIKQQQKDLYQMRRLKIITYLTQKQPHFLEDYSNLSSIDIFLQSFNYLQKLSNISFKGYFNINIRYKDVDYVPQNMFEQKQYVRKVCQNHFTQDLIKNLIDPQIKENYSQQHVCYKLTKLASTLFRICQQTYDLTTKNIDRDILSKKVLMQRQLQTVFSKDVQKLLNIQQHEAIIIVQSDFSSSYIIRQIDQKVSVQLSQKQQIYIKYFASYEFKDPFLFSLSNALFARKQKIFHETIQEYTNYLKKKDTFSQKSKYLLLFYNNIHSDPKNHLINVINRKLSLGQQMEPQGNLNKFLQILRMDSKKKDNLTSMQLLNSVFFLRMVSTLINKNRLMNIINGQINIMLKVKQRVIFLKRKSNLKFELSKQFITRYTETNQKKQDPFDFLRDTQTTDHKVNYQIPKDRLFIEAERNEVFVMRRNPQNPLFQGRKIIYQQAVRQTEQLIQQMVKLGSKVIEKRQNYLSGQDFTNIVNRIQLLYSLTHHEVNYQMAKLCLLNEYYQILDRTVSPQGIQIITEKIYKIKKQYFSMSLNQNNFIEEYQESVINFKLKSQLLKKLKNIQEEQQQKQVLSVKNGMVRKNLNQNSPQISSIYYAGSSNVQLIQQQSNQQTQMNDQILNFSNDFQNKQQINNAGNSALQTSQFSGTYTSHRHSDYHVKKTFKQILDTNQTSKIKSNLQKKQKMLNRKKKKLLNDSVLGKLLNFQVKEGQKNNFHSQHLWQVCRAMEFIQKTFQNDSKFKNISIENSALDLINEQVQRFQSGSMSLQDKLPEELLSATLHDCSKNLSKLSQKLKSHPSSIEHYLCFDPILMQNIEKGSISKEVDQYRGIYLGLNHIQMTQISYQNQLIKYRQERVKHYLQNAIKNYSNSNLSKYPVLLFQNILQNNINPKFKLLDTLAKNNQTQLIVLGRYNNYAKLLFLLDSLFLDFYSELLINIFQDHVVRFQSICIEMELMNKGNCWIGDGSTNKLNQFNGIQNKVWVSKKLQTLKQYRKNLFSKDFFADFLTVPSKIISETVLKKYTKPSIKDSASVISSSRQFSSYLQSLNMLTTKLLVLNWNLHQKFSLNKNIKMVQEYLTILPYMKTRVVINGQQQRILRQVFLEQLTTQKQKDVDMSQQHSQFIITSIKLKPSFLTLIIQSLGSNQNLQRQVAQIYSSLTSRQYLQFKSPKQTQNNRRQTTNYLHKNLGIVINPLVQSMNKFRYLIRITSGNLESEYQRVANLRKLIQIRLLLFGCQLSNQESIQFRCLLYDKTGNFQVFWKDQTSNIVQNKEFVKLKNFRLDSKQLIQRYRTQYLDFTNLKQKYKLLIQKLIETNLQEQLEDSIYLLVICVYYLQLQGKLPRKHKHNSQFDFLMKFGDEYQKPDQLMGFFKNIIKQKTSLTAIYKGFSFNQYIKILWHSPPQNSNFSEFRQFEERNRHLRCHINHLKRKTQEDIKTEILHFKFRKIVFQNVLKNCSVDTQSHRMRLQIFSKSFKQQKNYNQIILAQKQKYFYDLPANYADSKTKLESLKDEAFESVYFVKYYQKILAQQMYDLSTSILNGQLELKKVLGDSFQQRQLNKDNKIIRQSLNKVLAPKVMLNPFLNSPLLLDNYFFAGALKLSYIDHFLNRIKNRAIMIDLAQGGFGFLLKINQLDQCVNALCKGITSYSEKQFNDRLRTYFEYTDEIKQKLIQTKKQNQHLKTMNKLHQFYDQKQIKSLLYGKLNKYLQCLTQKQQTYGTLFDMFRNLQNKVMEQCDFKYQKKISKLEDQNVHLKETFKDFQQKLKQASITNISESKDLLYNDFKNKIQKILSRQCMPKYQQIQSSPFNEKQSYDSQILLQKLKQQNTVSKLKISVMKSQYQKRIEQLQNKLSQKDKLLKVIKEQRQKNYNLIHQVGFLSNKAIEVQSLEKQRKIDLQQRALQKFKLIRINQALQGRLERIQTVPKSKQLTNRQHRQLQVRKTQDSIFITKQSKRRSHTQFGIQTISQNRFFDRIKKRSGALKTQPTKMIQVQHQSGKLQNIDQARIWRQRWQKIATKYQYLSNKIKIISQNFKITRNGKKVGEKLLYLVDQINHQNSSGSNMKISQLSQII